MPPTAVEDSSAEGLDNPAYEPEGTADAKNVTDFDPPLPTSAPSKAAEAGAGADAGDEAAADEGTRDRQQWSNGIEFLLSCIAMSVGLGNVWRFPFTAYQNGGGAFLIPYIIVLIVIGRPLYYMEMALGQFTSYGCVKIWNMVPALKGVGYGQILATACVLSYYCSLMALTFFYLGSSFQKTLPWAECREEWGESCVPSSGADDNVTGNTSSAELFFLKFVLKEPDDLEGGIGTPDWRLTLALLGSWIIIYFVIIRGVQSSGKASYFLALFPYVVMVALLIRGVTLTGAREGIEFFITPKWEKLYNAQVWYAAVTQAFFSLNVGFGSLIVYSSYNAFRHNIYRDAMIVTTLDTLTSLLAGFTTFAILGNLKHELGEDSFDNVVRAGAGLAFVSYPDAIAKFDAVPQLFSVLFFLMLLTLGAGSAVALVNAINTIITDSFPKLRYSVVITVICICGFLVGLVYVTPGGQWILTMVDHYGATYPVLALGCVETAAIAWIYGVDNICADLEYMLGRKPGGYWRLTWGFITPVFLIVVLIYAAVKDENLRHDGKLYPDHYYPIGWTLTAVVVAFCPCWAVYEVIKRWRSGMSFTEAIRTAFSPNEEWGPRDAARRAGYQADRKERERWLADEGDRGAARNVGRILCGCGPQYTPAANDDMS